MEIKTQRINDIGIICFAGKTLGDPADSKVFEGCLNDLIDQHVNKIILDLGKVERINSTGLAILITASTLFSDSGGKKVVLTGSNDFINGALAVTKLNQFFDCYDELNDAIASLENILCE
ncbi:MAG: STAS domain-containing protein [bacterium]|nr:STAS domain-containing protein [bacterium]